jgi:predicted secreted Zn-dependent protease
MVVVPPSVPVSWQKSSASGDGECVLVRRTPSCVWVRDSKNPRGPVLEFSREAWVTFLCGVKSGEFECVGVPA